MRRKERDVRFDHYIDSLPDFKVDLHSWGFWRTALIIFLFFSIVGHLLEFFWWWGLNLADKWSFPTGLVAEPYGFGALAILIFVYPLVKRKKVNVAWAFVAGVLATTAVEFLCALVQVLVYGHNPFWDYSHNFLNLFGFVCLENSLAFGFVSLVFVYFLFPWLDHLLGRVNKKALSTAVVIIAICYTFSLLSQLLGFGRIVL